MAAARLLWLPPLVVAAALFTYLTADGPGEYRGPTHPRTIVAYSARKRAEMQGREYRCRGVDEASESTGVPGGFRRVEGTGVYAWSVAVDERLEPFKFVRMVGVVKGRWDDVVYCQIRSTNGSYHITKPTFVPIWNSEWDKHDRYAYFNPVLVSCRIPFEIEPESVSFSSQPCKISPSKYPLVRKGKKKRKSFTICVKPLNFLEDISKRLIQWIEINKILGADHFHIFVEKVHSNVTEVLKWYSSNSSSLVTIKKFQPIVQLKKYSNFSYYLWQKRRNEIVAYNDCFYDNLNSKFVVPLDLDEIIVPKTVDTWNNLFKNINNNFTNYIVQNTYYFTKYSKNVNLDEISFFKYTKRSTMISEKTENCKSFISTREALTIFNHYALKTLTGGNGRNYFFPFDRVQMNHYKSSCKSVILPKCQHFLSSPRIGDPVIFKYRKRFLENYRKVLKEINLM